MKPTTPEANKELREAVENLFKPKISGSGATITLHIGKTTLYRIDYEDFMAIRDSIIALITSDKQRLLKELLEHKTKFHNPAIKEGVFGAFVEVVPISVIQNKLEGLS